MATSQNNWKALTTAKLQAEYLTTVTVPDTDPVRRFHVRKGAVAKVLLYVATRFHREVESLNEGHPNDDWSFAYRKVRGSSSISNHASGTAIDLNATQHPLGTSPTANFTAKQRAAIREILNDCDGVIRWGGDYSGRKDPMHFEINRGADAVKALADRISQPEPEEPEDDDMEHRYYFINPAAINGKTTLMLRKDPTDGPALGADMRFVVTATVNVTGSGSVWLYQYDPDKDTVYHDYEPETFTASGLVKLHQAGTVTHGRHLRLAATGDATLTGGRIDMLYQ